jgi:hypothetical protein
MYHTIDHLLYQKKYRRLIFVLENGDFTLSDIMDQLRMPTPHASRKRISEHLGFLVKCGYVHYDNAPQNLYHQFPEGKYSLVRPVRIDVHFIDKLSYSEMNNYVEYGYTSRREQQKQFEDDPYWQ